ncbi:MAG: response regulator [Ignavibacterium sp.]|nr:response regulator [Ignavibacterium sp.]
MKSQKKKILVIEDDEIISDNLKNLLELQNYEVWVAENGKEGIDKAYIFKPDLVICDIMMPDITGFEVIEILSRENDLKQLPFLYLTALIDITNFRKGMNLGADDYIFKPYDSENLLLVIKNRLEKFELIRSIALEQKSNKNYQNESEKIIIKLGNKSYPLNYKEIIYLMAERQYSNVYTTGQKKFIIKKSLKNWEMILPKSSFIRIHRSCIININQVNKIEKNSLNQYSVHLNNSNNAIQVSRRFYKNLKKLSV